MPKDITLDEYKEVSPEFFAKFNFVSGELPKGTSAEDVIKVMQQLAALVLKKRSAKKQNAVGFMKGEFDNDQDA